jgi:DUF2950 family protein
MCLVGALALTFLPAPSLVAGPRSSPASPGGVTLFDTPQQAGAAFIDAAEKWDVVALMKMVGDETEEIIFTGDYEQDKERAAEFAALARKKMHVDVDPKDAGRATLYAGENDWPFPVPIVKNRGKWSFDASVGRDEIVARRIGANELDAIDVCRGYVEAQHEYALQKREGYDVNQYAQRIISTPGKQDGLAWQNADGTWDGPVGENVAKAIEQGFRPDGGPYHGYFFKVLKGQGPTAPLGQLDYVQKGVMIGGFALVAAPAEYGATGLKTFIVSQDGVVYQKDLGEATLDEFKKMELFNPDDSWSPVDDDKD